MLSLIGSPPPSWRNRLQRGFTLVELLTVVAVLGIITALAAPSFNGMMERYRVRQVTEELKTTLYFARSEAIKNNGGIHVVPNSNWSQGWQVKLGGTALRETSAPNKVQISLTSTNGGSNQVDLDRYGMLMSGGKTTPENLTFTVTPTGNGNYTCTLLTSPGGLLQQSCL